MSDPNAFEGESVDDIIEDLVEVYRGVVPPDIANTRRRLDEAYAISTMLSAAEAAINDWARNSLVSTAEGQPLDALGNGEGLHRQGGETDDQFRPRLRVPPSANSAEAIIAALQQIVDANGGGQVFLIELPRDGAYVSRPSSIAGGDFGIATLSRGHRMSGGVVRMVIALIPASANCLASCTDALRSKVSAAKAYLVQEYVSG